jgi:hypothetical protein
MKIRELEQAAAVSVLEARVQTCLPPPPRTRGSRGGGSDAADVGMALCRFQ